MMMSLLRSVANVVLVLALVSALDSHESLLKAIAAGAVSLVAISVLGVGIPHAWASYAGEKTLAVTFPVVAVLWYTFWPVVALMRIFDIPIRRLSGFSEEENQNGDTAKQEVISAATEGRAEGAMDADEVDMIESVMELDETHAGEIMTPRTDIFALPVETAFAEACRQITEAGHTRVPVYEEDLDKIIGVVYAKDLLQFLDADQPPPLRQIMRKPYFVPESKALDGLLTEFKARKQHLAIVLDEYGGTAGLVTVEDILEEIVGEISDEYDKPEPQPMTLVDEHTAEIDGRMYIDDLNDALKLKIPEDEDYDTAAGLVAAELGHIPEPSETIEAYGARFTVLAADERKITRLRVEVLEEGEAEEGT
jgi:CBS domain containing-hemolysin-like protein